MLINEHDPVEQELNLVSFSESVEKHYRDQKFDSYISAVVDLATEMDIDDKDVLRYLSPTLLKKLELEAVDNGQLKPTSSPMVTF